MKKNLTIISSLYFISFSLVFGATVTPEPGIALEQKSKGKGMQCPALQATDCPAFSMEKESGERYLVEQPEFIKENGILGLSVKTAVKKVNQEAEISSRFFSLANIGISPDDKAYICESNRDEELEPYILDNTKDPVITFAEGKGTRICRRIWIPQAVFDDIFKDTNCDIMGPHHRSTEGVLKFTVYIHDILSDPSYNFGGKDWENGGLGKDLGSIDPKTSTPTPVPGVYVGQILSIISDRMKQSMTPEKKLKLMESDLEFLKNNVDWISNKIMELMEIEKEKETENTGRRERRERRED